MSAYSHIAEPRPMTRWGRLDLAPRRDSFGLFHSPAEEMGQPQDGATKVEKKAIALRSALLQRLQEPEDAGLTGGTRSLMRRVLGLNVTSRLKMSRIPATAIQRTPAA